MATDHLLPSGDINTHTAPTQPQMTYQRQDPMQQEPQREQDQSKKDKKDKKDKKKKKKEHDRYDSDERYSTVQFCADCLNMWSSCIDACFRACICRGSSGGTYVVVSRGVLRMGYETYCS
ncbi:hypothetical protein TWF718_000536 [Orbilia javanica]|uniref:Uncharacterized protein n=1 Tax=Orbilia javanica TaxID=47235 RepID=A0AAN8NFJ3_9PEZI